MRMNKRIDELSDKSSEYIQTSNTTSIVDIQNVVPPTPSQVVEKTLPANSTSVINSDSSKRSTKTTRPQQSHRRRLSAPSKIRTSKYLINPSTSLFSPTLPAHVLNTNANQIQTWVDASTRIPPPTNESTPPPTAQNIQKQHKNPPVIVGNITNTHTQSDTLKKIRSQFENTEIMKIEFLNCGDLAITPKYPKDVNSLLLMEKWDNVFFGEHLYIYLADSDICLWYCVNKIPLEVDIHQIRNALEELKTPSGHSIHAENIHRKAKGSHPTTSVIFKVREYITELTDTNIYIDRKEYTIKKFVQSEVLRCTNCQGFGHLLEWCNSPQKCVRCSAPNWEVMNCNNTQGKCVNCGWLLETSVKTLPRKKMTAMSTSEKNKRHSFDFKPQQNYALEQTQGLNRKVEYLAQENHILNTRISKLEEGQKSSINNDQLGEILTRVLRNIIPFNNEQAFKEIFDTISREIHNVMLGDQPTATSNSCISNHIQTKDNIARRAMRTKGRSQTPTRFEPHGRLHRKRSLSAHAHSLISQV